MFTMPTEMPLELKYPVLWKRPDNKDKWPNGRKSLLDSINLICHERKCTVREALQALVDSSAEAPITFTIWNIVLWLPKDEV